MGYPICVACNDDILDFYTAPCGTRHCLYCTENCRECRELDPECPPGCGACRADARGWRV